MNPIDEPRPRETPRPWTAYIPPVSAVTELPIPQAWPTRDFFDVLTSRRSRVGGAVSLDHLAELLWHSAGTKGHAANGRAGIPVEWRTSPSGGGLHPIHVVCVSSPPSEDVFWYDGFRHALGTLFLDGRELVDGNANRVREVVGNANGWTLRFVADFSKVDAAYENPWSIILRDAGCLIATICLCAEWLGLAACPLGFVGQELCNHIGLDESRFRAVGGVQITSKP